jgi:enoyl-CoA hydratase/carnithine racemase
MADEILCTVTDGIATITLNRPESRNALNSVVLDGLRRYVDELDRDRAVRVIVIRGAGPAFCSGMDLKTIAMIQGAAFAGGCELALHCDLRVAADVARFAMPLARIGLVVPFPLGQKLVEIVGPAFAREILLTGRPLDARRAYEMGMLHAVVPAAELERATYDMARAIAENAPLSLAGMKAMIGRAVSLRERLEHADLDELARRARASTDAREGVRAMLEKRKPAFRGE